VIGIGRLAQVRSDLGHRRSTRGSRELLSLVRRQPPVESHQPYRGRSQRFVVGDAERDVAQQGPERHRRLRVERVGVLEHDLLVGQATQSTSTQ
jgi:hypothetical protein